MHKVVLQVIIDRFNNDRFSDMYVFYYTDNNEFCNVYRIGWCLRFLRFLGLPIGWFYFLFCGLFGYCVGYISITCRHTGIYTVYRSYGDEVRGLAIQDRHFNRVRSECFFFFDDDFDIDKVVGFFQVGNRAYE